MGIIDANLDRSIQIVINVADTLGVGNAEIGGVMPILKGLKTDIVKLKPIRNTIEG
mgnify:CR=1 FL=1